MPRTISIAMIVKDECHHLAECLDSLQGIADEICIVDTGSTDDTMEVARRYGANVSFFIWCDDFSAARNESLRLCTGDWIFIIDADERLAAEDIAAIRTLADGPMDCCYRFTTRNYTNTESVSEFTPCEEGHPHARGFVGWYPSTKVRMFPNDPRAAFEGKVHELVNASLERVGMRILDCAVPIHHYPLAKDPKRVRDKQILYLQLGHQKLKSNPDDPKTYAELGDQYAEVSDYPKAAAAYKESLARDPYNPFVLKDLGGMLHLMGRNDEAKQSLKLALQLDPDLAEAWRNLGVVYADEKEWDNAAECFQEAVAADPSWTLGHRYLSVALEYQDKFEHALDASRKALELNPGSDDCLKLYTHQILRLERREEGRAFLRALLDAGEDSPMLHDAIGELCYYDKLFDEAEHHFMAAAEGGISWAYNNLGLVYYVQKRFEEAKDAFEKCVIANPGHRGARKNLQMALAKLKRRRREDSTRD